MVLFNYIGKIYNKSERQIAQVIFARLLRQQNLKLLDGVVDTLARNQAIHVTTKSGAVDLSNHSISARDVTGSNLTSAEISGQVHAALQKLDSNPITLTLKEALENLRRSVDGEESLDDSEKVKLLQKIKDLSEYGNGPQTKHTKAEAKGIITTLGEHAKNATNIVKFAETFTKYSSTLMDFFA